MTRKNKGYIIMIIGILLPLYSLTSISYNELKSFFSYKIYNETKVSDYKKSYIEKHAKEYNDEISAISRGIVDPFVYSDYSSNYGARMLGNNVVFAYLWIPKIELYKPVLLDSTQENLSKGLAHIEGTNLPIGGKNTRCVIAGHRGWYRDVMFLNINSLVKGDKIYISTVLGTKLIYTVTDKEIITPYEWEKLNPRIGEDMLSLLTCEPISPYAPYRLIVNAIRDEEKSRLEDIEFTKKDIKVIGIKYSIYFITVFLWLLILFIIIKIMKK